MSELPDVSIAALRRLARGLLYDRHGAEDVVQEAWLAALASGPRSMPLGAWLACTVRRLAQNRRRAEARRRERERGAARSEATPSALDATAHIEVLRRLLDALERLDEPYRSAVTLRYLEEAPPREIARRLGVPVNTARTHVRRGLERLRRDLDGERGEGRQHSLAALVLFAGPGPWWKVLAPAGETWTNGLGKGALLVQKKVAIVVVVLLGAGALWFTRPGEGSAQDEVAAELALPLVPASVTASDDAPAPSINASPTIAQRTPEASMPITGGSWVVHGQALQGSSEPFPGLALIGRVFPGPQPEGTPLLEAHLRADESGAFTWPLEPPTELVTIHVTASIAGYAVIPAWQLALPGDPPLEPLVVRVRPLDCTVRGLVQSPSRAPLAGATVRELDEFEPQFATTDGTGRFRLRIASGRERRVHVRAAEFAQRTITIDAQCPGELDAGTIVLGEELRLRGRVLDEQGAPVAGARVAPAYPFFDEGDTTDENGAFELGTLDRETNYLSVVVQKDGYRPLGKSVGRAERMAPLELRLFRGVRLTGTVRTPTGEPVWGAWIALGSSLWMNPSIETYSDREGRFEFAHAPRGPETVWAWRRGFAQVRIEEIIPSSAEEHALEVRLEPGHFVGGQVLDATGKGVRWALVSAEDGSPGNERIWGYQARADANGRFRIDDLPAIPLRVGAFASGHARVEVETTAADRDDLVLRLEPTGGFAGTVVDAESGAPVPTFLVHLQHPGEGHERDGLDGISVRWWDGVAITDPDGHWRIEDDFELDKVAALTVEAAGYAPTTIDVRSVASADPADLVVRLVRGTFVRGRVVEKATGAPVSGVRVRRVTDRQPYASLATAREPVPEATTDAAGRFEFENLPAGKMSLALEHPQWTTVLDGPFELSAAPLERWIELDSGGGVHGRLLDAAGRGVSGETVSVYGLDGLELHRTHASTTDESGAYRILGLAPGRYHLRWERKRGDCSANDLLQQIALAEGQELEVDLRPRGRAIVRGTLAFEGSIPDLVTVMFLPEDRPTPDELKLDRHWARCGRATFAERGVFELEGFEAGRWNAIASFQSNLRPVSGSSGFFDVPEVGTVDVRIELKAR